MAIPWEENIWLYVWNRIQYDDFFIPEKSEDEKSKMKGQGNKSPWYEKSGYQVRGPPQSFA